MMRVINAGRALGDGCPIELNSSSNRDFGMRTAALTLLVGCLGLAMVGCGPSFSAKAQHGITFYCPGAGNIDFGDAGVREGLAKAGYKGQVASVIWDRLAQPGNRPGRKGQRQPRRGQAGTLHRVVHQEIPRTTGEPDWAVRRHRASRCTLARISSQATKSTASSCSRAASRTITTSAGRSSTSKKTA